MSGSADENGLLVALQRGLPLEPRPFAALAAAAGAREGDVLALLDRLFREGKARRLGGVFDARRLGYRSVLGAASVRREDLARLGHVVAAHAGVTHAYERGWPAELDPASPGGPRGEPAPNLWFTLAVPHATFDREWAALRAACAPYELLALPASTRFKIDVVFDTRTRDRDERFPGAGAAPGVAVEAAAETLRLDAREQDVVRYFQDHVAPESDLFGRAALALGMTEEALLSILRRWRTAGVLRRIALVLRHREAGFRANGMCTWRVPGRAVAEAGRTLAAFDDVTHCYERPAAPAFPYNLYAMIHGRAWHEVQAVYERLTLAIGLTDGRLLFSLQEFKKSSMVYFSQPDHSAAGG